MVSFLLLLIAPLVGSCLAHQSVITIRTMDGTGLDSKLKKRHSIKDAAKFCQVDESTVYEWIAREI